MNLSFPSSDSICSIRDPLDWTEDKNKIMWNACREMAQFHFMHSPEIKSIYSKARFQPEQIQSEADLERIPMLAVTAMKFHLITSMPHDQCVLQLTSSGTKGQKTQIWFDQKSLDRVQRQMDVYLEQEGFVSTQKTNYMIFTYDPEDAKDLGIAYSDKNLQRFAPAHRVHYTIKKNAQGQWHFDVERALVELKSFVNEGLPVRMLGMPGFIHEFLTYLKTQNEKVACPKESLMLTGGGWKAAEDKQITRESFRNEVAMYLGIPTERMRDGYGMAEHCAPYFECRHHRFHIPAYCRIIIRDPVTLRSLPAGQSGLMELITPFNTMMPTLAILTTDYGILDADPCSCGWKSPTFTLQGRAGLNKHKGCALAASDIIRR